MTKKKLRRHEHSIMRELAFQRRRRRGTMSEDEFKSLELGHGWHSEFRNNVLRAAVMPRGGKRIMARLVWPLRLLSPEEGCYADRPRWPGMSLKVRRPRHGIRWRNTPVKGPYRPWMPLPAFGPDAPLAAFSRSVRRPKHRKRLRA